MEMKIVKQNRKVIMYRIKNLFEKDIHTDLT